MKNETREEKRRGLIARMLSAEETRQILTNLSNTQLADLVRLHIWAKLPLYSPDSELIEEIIDRLEGEKGADE